MKKILAVYDDDASYAEKLSSYLNKKEDGIFSAVAFTSKEKLEEYAKGHEIDLLLSKKTDDGEAPDIRTGKTLFLTEDREGVGEDGICKYQPGDEILREVMSAYADLPESEIYPMKMSGTGGKRLIGVYSPVNRCGKTSLALAIAQIIAKEEKTILITLDSFSGLACLLDEKWKRDLSDLIYFYKQGRYTPMRLNSVLYYIGELAWIPPIRFPEDLSEISAKEMAELVSCILGESSFDTAVLDIGDYARQMIPFLEHCTVVYVPVKDDIQSLAKLDEFSEYLDIMGKGFLKERFYRVHVPAMNGVRRMEYYPQELLWGDMGDFVRSLLNGGSEEWES